MTLYLYYLIIGAPGRGWVVPEFLKKLAFKCLKMYSDDIVTLLFDQGSPRRRVGSAKILKKLAFKCMEIYSVDIVSLLFDHRSPRWRLGSA